MNCRTLEYIVAVKETGSVLQAAKACNVTVGTISGFAGVVITSSSGRIVRRYHEESYLPGY